jgi:hypothetical protein
MGWAFLTCRWGGGLSLLLLVWLVGCNEGSRGVDCPADYCSGHGDCDSKSGEMVCDCYRAYAGARCGLCAADYQDNDGDGTCQPTCAKADLDCGEFGHCDDATGRPECRCDAGYQRIGGLCVPERKHIGEACSDSLDCASGWCLKYIGDEVGYCSRRDCLADADCVNTSDDGAEMCCVDVGGDHRVCLKNDPGCGCGDQTGKCGASCSCQLDSACHPTQACLRTGPGDPDAVCSHECTTDAECADCVDPENPGTRFICQPISGGGYLPPGATYCLAAVSCASSLDCAGVGVCYPWATPDGQELEGVCGRRGELPTGAECDDAVDPNDLPSQERCAAFYCLDGHCSAVCTRDADCPAPMFCDAVTFRMAEGGDRFASIGMCRWLRCSCTACARDADCEGGEVCGVLLPPAGEVELLCRQPACDAAAAGCGAVGDPCDPAAADCANELCLPAGHCSTPCVDDSDCAGHSLHGQPMRCIPLTLVTGHQLTACTAAEND